MSHRRQIAAVAIGIALTAAIAILYNHRHGEPAQQAQEPTAAPTSTPSPTAAPALILRPTSTPSPTARPAPTRKPGPPRVTNARLRAFPVDESGINCIVAGTQPAAIHEEIAAGGIRWSRITAGDCSGWIPSIAISR